jgi:hypothetical protein
MRSSRLRTVALAVALCATALGASGARNPDVKYPPGASPSAMLIGTEPAPPTGDPPGTTPVASDTTQVSKLEETHLKPQEGDHSHSTLAPQAQQKADGVDPRPAPAAPEANENKADAARKAQ